MVSRRECGETSGKPSKTSTLTMLTYEERSIKASNGQTGGGIGDSRRTRSALPKQCRSVANFRTVNGATEVTSPPHMRSQFLKSFKLEGACVFLIYCLKSVRIEQLIGN